MLKVTTKIKTTGEILEEVRRQMVHSMRTGKTFVISVDDMRPDFVNEYTAGDSDFPTSKIFDLNTWFKDDIHMKIVREDENKNIMGDSGTFMIHPDFRICILAKYRSDEDCQEFLGKVPHSADMLKFFIE